MIKRIYEYYKHRYYGRYHPTFRDRNWIFDVQNEWEGVKINRLLNRRYRLKIKATKLHGKTILRKIIKQFNMLKIYSLLLALSCATASFSQGYDLELSLVNPVSASTVASSAAVPVEFSLTNNGPTTIPAGDTLLFAYFNGTSAYFGLDNTPNGVSGSILAADLTSGSSISFGSLSFDLSAFATGDTVNVFCFGVGSAALSAAGDMNESDFTNNADFFFVGTTSGLNELETEVVVYPNPTTEILNVETTETVRSIVVFGLNGQIVSEIENSNSINVSALKAGNYIYKIETELGSVISNTFVKK